MSYPPFNTRWARLARAFRSFLSGIFEFLSIMMLLACGLCILCVLGCAAALLFPGAIRATEDGSLTAAAAFGLFALCAFVSALLHKLCRDLAEYFNL